MMRAAGVNSIGSAPRGRAWWSSFNVAGGGPPPPPTPGGGWGGGAAARRRGAPPSAPPTTPPPPPRGGGGGGAGRPRQNQALHPPRDSRAIFLDQKVRMQKRGYASGRFRPRRRDRGARGDRW